MSSDPARPDLTAEQVAAVDRVAASLDLSAKIGQLFCAYLVEPDTERQLHDWGTAGFAPGGVLILAREEAKTRADVELAQAWSPIPLLVAANLEEGAAVIGGHDDAFANPLQVGATGDPEHARRLGLACGSLGRDLGINWAFAPVVDLSLNPQNPIVRTRTFGRDSRLVAAMGAAYVTAVQACGVAASLKHFPGDGVDDRDQHLVTTDNTLDLDSWRASFGEVYRAGIQAGAMSVMAGHIRLPALAGGDLPATLSPALLNGLLRDELGFDGLIVTDNTAMAGFSTVLPRDRALPVSLNAGCDMLLGAIDPLEDHAILLRAVDRGEVSMARVDEALRRVLTLKARLGLLDATAPTGLASVSRPAIERWRRDCAERAITLVHDRSGLLPLSNDRFPRVLLYVVGDEPTFYDPTGGYGEQFSEALSRRGLAVTVRAVPGDGRSIRSEHDLQRAHDLIVYFANVRFTGNSNSCRITWSHPQAPEVPRHVDVPTVMVSIADPYHLQDVPFIGTYVNAYSPTAHTVDALTAAMFGDIPFHGTSPVDPWAAEWAGSLVHSTSSTVPR